MSRSMICCLVTTSWAVVADHVPLLVAHHPHVLVCYIALARRRPGSWAARRPGGGRQGSVLGRRLVLGGGQPRSSRSIARGPIPCTGRVMHQAPCANRSRTRQTHRSTPYSPRKSMIVSKVRYQRGHCPLFRVGRSSSRRRLQEVSGVRH